MKSLAVCCVLGLFAAGAVANLARAQGAPPPPQPLGAPPVPAQNPSSNAKIKLGETLFWEEQLSITGTVACGTCHRGFGGGADPRTALAGTDSRSPGPDGIFGGTDDIGGSLGVPAHSLDGTYLSTSAFGLDAQVGTRRAMSAIDAAYAPLLFWDGRAGGSFTDPDTNTVLIPQGAALENQALGPLLNNVEMAYLNALSNSIGHRLDNVAPLALATNVPTALQTWIAGRRYPALFQEAFGTSERSAAHIAMAIATYERTLVATQTPFDAQNGGTPNSLTAAEQRGQQVFVATDCAACHAGALLSDNQFHYDGVRPVNDDLGRFVQTGNNPDRGAFRTPSLRNAALRGPYMHNGRLATLTDVVEFYNRGGDFTAPNKDPRVRPRNLTAQQKSDLVAFLGRPLTDSRSAAETAPFDRPTLFTESDRAPHLVGNGVAGSGGVIPQIGAVEPPLFGNRNFTVAVTNGLGAATATLVVSHSDPGIAATLPSADFASLDVTLSGVGAANGYASVNVDLGTDPSLPGQTLYGRFYIADPSAPNQLAITPAFAITVFGDGEAVFSDGFE
jgi:cytochrome c peroxidase